MSRSSFPTRLTMLALGVVAALLGACKRNDPDWDRRSAWIQRQTAENNLFVRDVLTRDGFDYQFHDGWYPAENDRKAGGAWRWMDKRGVVRLRTGLPNQSPRDMQLTIFGWVPHEHVGFRSLQMEFAVNGHVLGRFDPPPRSFEHVLRVPRALLQGDDYVDLVISVTNTAKPSGDWRDLGFATTGFHWKPVDGS
jgi:hypothetical protein